MIIPSKLITEINSLGLSCKKTAIAIDICGDICKRCIYLEKFVPINKKYYTKVIGTSGILEIIKKLLTVGIIERDYYKPNEKSYHYRIAKNYNDFLFHKTRNVNLKKLQEKQKRENRKEFNKLPDYLRRMAKRIREVEFHIEKIKDWINTYTPSENELEIKNEKRKQKGKTQITMEVYTAKLRESMLFSLANVEHGNWTFHRDGTVLRLHTNITNMKTALLKKSQTKLVEIDVKNSQPFMLNILLDLCDIHNKHKNKELTNTTNNTTPYNDVMFPLFNIAGQLVKQDFSFINGLLLAPSFYDEVVVFSNITSNGGFYEYFQADSKIDRDMVKVMMYQILFSKNESYIKSKTIFRNKFPMICKFVEWVKRDEHNQLSIILSKIESYIMIDVLCKRLDEAGIIPITKHDSILIAPEQEKCAVQIFKDVFMETCRCIPSFEIKPLND